VPHLLRHRTSVFKIISKRPLILSSKCCAPCEGAITTYFNVLGLTRPARAGLELTTSQMLSESVTLGYRNWSLPMIAYGFVEDLVPKDYINIVYKNLMSASEYLCGLSEWCLTKCVSCFPITRNLYFRVPVLID
jgi:hypothetical protein